MADNDISNGESSGLGAARRPYCTSVGWRACWFASLMLILLTVPTETPLAQTWPNQPIKFIVPLPAGGAYDYIARLLADRLAPVLGTTIVVENKPGASAQIGTAFVARATADGYTFLVMANTHVISPNLFSNLPYDAIKDFEPVSLIVTSPFVLVITPKISVRSAKEYVALAKAKPGSIEFGSSGIGSPFHLAGEQMKAMAAIDLLHVPYRGTAPLIQALLAQDIASAFVPVGPYLPYINEGKLRALATVDTARSAIMPELPTIAEDVPLPGYGLNSWIGMLAPAATPREIVDRMSKTIAAIVQDKAIVERLFSQGYEAVGSTPDEFLKVMKQDIATYRKLVRDANVSIQ